MVLWVRGAKCITALPRLFTPSLISDEIARTIRLPEKDEMYHCTAYEMYHCTAYECITVQPMNVSMKRNVDLDFIRDYNRRRKYFEFCTQENQHIKNIMFIFLPNICILTIVFN